MIVYTIQFIFFLFCVYLTIKAILEMDDSEMEEKRNYGTRTGDEGNNQDKRV